jgi:beta-lactamase regulating signal transducer with metallopeptidase domain
MSELTGIPWFSFLLELLLKSTLALAVALLITALLQKKSASLRHFVLAVFLIGLLIFPMISVLPFGWETSLLPPKDLSKIQESIPLTLSGPDSGPQSTELITAGMDTGFSSDSKDLLRAESKAAFLFQAAAPLPLGRVLNAALVLLWSTGLCLLLLRLGLGLLSASRITREGKPVVDPVWRILLNNFLSAIGLKRPIRLKSHNKVIVPLTWGLIKPVILIPSGHESWSKDQKSSALFHELSHIKRADFMVTILVRLSLALFWFNPLSWIVFRQMKSEQEKACDELVLKAGIKPSTYAANLLMFRGAAGPNWAPPAALLGLFGRSSFGERLTAILKQKLTFKEVTMKTKLFFGSVIILALAFIGTAQPTAAAPDMVADNVISQSDVYSQVIAPGQIAAENQEEEKAMKAEKQEEQEKKEKQEKEIKKINKISEHTIVITTMDGSKDPIEITIVSGDKKEILKVNETITIKKGKEGEVIILDADGKELKVVEGSPIHLSIKEGNFELIEEGDIELVEGKAFMVGKDVKLAWTQKGKENERKANVYVYSGKDGNTFTIKKTDSHGWIHENEEGEKTMDIHVVTEKGAKNWTDKDKEFNVYFSPEKSDLDVNWISKEDNSELKDNLKNLRKNLENLKAAGADITESLKSLEELEHRLNAHKNAFVGHIISGESPKAYTVIKKGEGDEDVKGMFFSQSESKKAIAYISGEGEAQIIYSVSEEGKSREAYEKILVLIKKELPEGAKLESEFDEESGVIKLKIISRDGENLSKDFIKKLTDIIKKETEK